MKKRIFEIIQIGNRTDFLSHSFDIFIAITIILNVLTLFFGTFSEMDTYKQPLKIVETITMIIFCVEYILRIWTAPFLYPQYSKKKSIFKFLVSYDGIVDLLTILPFFFLSGFIVFRMLRVVRIFHLFRINSTYDSFNVITTVINDKKGQILSSVFIILVLICASSLCMYSVEHDVQPDKFKNAFSGIWWAVSTVLTVGYGDIYPITTLGKLIAIIIGFLGVGVVAIPSGILSAGFVEQYTKYKEMNTTYIEKNENKRYTIINITNNSDWKNKKIKDTKLSSNDFILIIRGTNIVTINDNVTFKVGDKIILNI